MKDKKQLLDLIEDDIKSLNLPEKEKRHLIDNFQSLRNNPVNILVVGATGSGKSSTINAILCSEVCEVGVGTDAETKDIQCYKLANLVLWDSPGFGESRESDERNGKRVVQLLNEVDEYGFYKIDLVMVVVEAGAKDMGTTFRLINEIIIPSIGKDNKERILVVINQSDVALKGRHWNARENVPEPALLDYLDNKVESVSRRIYRDTGLDVRPIYYSAGYKNEGEPQGPAYNLSTIIYHIIGHIPGRKRVAFANYVKEQEILPDNDSTMKEFMHAQIMAELEKMLEE